MLTYKASNGRIIHRKLNGRFRKTSLQDFGISKFQLQIGKAVCADCGFGEIENWKPILKTGFCPKCGSQNKRER